ncbi:hypothetical protein AGDE_13015 [Angomonas deanei]|nr:hypothetical protein AGDE_13015 [Angomonas deanei]|eukprot:EPY23110.1 hypothetical protein AGDE_13015 [Angomonas deanei]
MLPPVKHVIQYFSKVLKGSLLDPQQLYHYHTNASNSTTLMSTSQFSKSQTSQSGRKRVAKFVELTDEEKKQQQALVDEHATKLLDYFKMKQEKESVMEFYRKVELNCAELEKQIMSSEDRFVASKRRPLNPSETAYVCTIDTGDDRMWKSILF